eukprot:gene11155-biopygen7790
MTTAAQPRGEPVFSEQRHGPAQCSPVKPNKPKRSVASFVLSHLSQMGNRATANDGERQRNPTLGGIGSPFCRNPLQPSSRIQMPTPRGPGVKRTKLTLPKGRWWR